MNIVVIGAVELVENPRRAAKRAGFFLYPPVKKPGTVGQGKRVFPLHHLVEAGGGMWKLCGKVEKSEALSFPVDHLDGGKEENFP